MDLKSFGRKMRVTGRAVGDSSDKLVRRVALAVDSTVVLATPVDTGRARSNWQAELNAPADGVIDAYADGKGASTAGANATAAMQQAAAVIATHKSGDSIHLTNNLPYIGRLNDGWSAQAPAGFVEQAVHAGVQTIRGAKIIIGGA
jgi:hypothetical protein